MRRTAIAVLLLGAAAPVAANDRRAAEHAMVEARAALADAERAGAPELARFEYLVAHDELAHMRAAARASDWTEAQFAARRTVVDAKLAAAVSRKARAERDAQRLEDAVATLRASLADGSVP